jgi:hypothetical protein
MLYSKIHICFPILSLQDGENISFDASLVIFTNSTNIPPIMVINRIYDTQNLQNRMKATDATRTRGKKIHLFYNQNTWLILDSISNTQNSPEFMMSYSYICLASRTCFMYWPPCIHISVLYFEMSDARAVLRNKTTIFTVSAKYYNCQSQE